MVFVDMTNDVAFRKVFSDQNHPQIIISFLNSILGYTGERTIVSVDFSNPHQFPAIAELKATALDVKVTDQSGREFIVEMQTNKEPGFYKRVLYYASKAYSQQLAEGDKYHTLKPVIFLGILQFKAFDGPDYITKHLIINQNTQVQDLQDMEFAFVELPKFVKELSDDMTLADKWIYFLKHASQQETIPPVLTEKPLPEAFDLAHKHSRTRQQLDVYDYRQMQDGIMEGVKQYEFQQGLEQGIQQGLQQAKQTTYQRLIDLGLSEQQARQGAGL